MAGERNLRGAEAWLVDLSSAAPALLAIEAHGPRLSEDDEAKCAAVADAAARRERRASHIALRILIERAFGRVWSGVAYVLSADGKPALAGLQGGFSLAHCRGYALIGLTPDGAIGVDIEVRRPVRMTEDRRRRIEAAAAALVPRQPLPADEDSRFLQAWVRLEALGKAEGRGVGPILSALRPVPADELREHGSAASRFVAHDLVLGGDIFAAFAVASGQTAPLFHRFPSQEAEIAKLLATARG